jgi:DNA repair protein RadC
MNLDNKKVDDFLQFIKDSDPAEVVEVLITKGIEVDKINFVCQMTLLKAELVIAQSVAFLNKPREQALVSDFLSKVTDKPAIETTEVKSKGFAVAELEISYKRKRKNSLIVDGAKIAYQVFREMWDESLMNVQEQVCALYLSFSGAVIGYRLLSTGTAKQCLVDTNLMVSFALLSRATGVILAHNHPSGNLQYSAADKEMTVAVQRQLNQFEITLLDHLIVTEDNYFSMKENRVLAF